MDHSSGAAQYRLANLTLVIHAVRGEAAESKKEEVLTDRIWLQGFQL